MISEYFPKDLKSGSIILETPSDYYRNNGYYNYIEYQATLSTEMSLVIQTGIYPLVATASIEAQGLFNYKLKEDITFTNGTPLVPINYNRITQVPVVSTFYKQATIAGGTILRDRDINYGTNPGQFATSGSGELAYFIFKPNSKYSLQLTPSVSLRMLIDLRFVEKH